MTEFTDFLSTLLEGDEENDKLNRINTALASDDDEDSSGTPLAGGLSALLGSLVGGDTKDSNESQGFDMSSVLIKALPMISMFSEGENDPKVQLLYAIRPYLTGERIKRLDDAVMFIKLSRLAGPVMDILDGFEKR